MALIDISIAVATHLALSFNREIMMHPEPVPMSKIFFDLSIGRYFKLSSIINSVSGLGIKTELLIINFDR